MLELKFAKFKEGAIIPSKRDEDAGYDLFACFDGDELVIYPGQTKLIPTGIGSIIPDGYVAIGKERGSTGTKGLRFGAGVIDSSYRGEWFVPINNTSNKTIVISKDIEKSKTNFYQNILIYPQTKGIGQFILLPVPKTVVLDGK